jgi:hypothetical protein
VNERAIRLGLWVVAVTALAVGVLLSIRTLAIAAETAERIDTRLEQYAELLIVEADLAACLAAAQAFAALPAQQPAELGALMVEVLPDHSPQDDRDFTQPAGPGWTLYRREVSFAELPLGDVMRLVSTLEAERPPWRLAKCVIRSSSRTAGAGEVILTLEALARADQGSSRTPTR